MKSEILRCPFCLAYTLNEICNKCNSKTITIKPAKFSLSDKYGSYRRAYILKNEMGN